MRPGRFLAVLVAAAAVAAAVALNVLLLGTASAQSSPVGQLKLSGHIPVAPHWTVHPTKGAVRDEGADD